MKKLLIIGLLTFGLFGCDNYKRKQYTTVEQVAPVTTLVYLEDFTDSERVLVEQHITNNITTVNNTFNVSLDVEVHVVKQKVKPTWRGRKLLLWCGDNFDLPELYDELCKKARHHK